MITITTLDRDLARLLEPLAPRPDLRFNAVRKLSAAGLRVAVNLAPIMPLINDAEPSLDAVAKASARAGAAQLGGNVVFLKDCAQKVFFPFLERTLSRPICAGIGNASNASAYLSGELPGHDSRTLAAHSPPLRLRRTRRLEAEPELWPQDPQMTLFS